MAFKKQPYSWGNVKAGDIISFSYQSSRDMNKKISCILVLNPKLPVSRKDGSTTFHLTGIKLKENSKPTIVFSTNNVKILERIGKFVAVDFDDDVFRLNIDKGMIISEVKGVKTQGYNKIATNNRIRENYRTFDWLKARKSPVFLEWIKVSEKDNYEPKKKGKK